MLTPEKGRQMLEWFVDAGGRFSGSTWMVRHGDSGFAVVEDLASGEEIARLRDWRLAELLAELPNIVAAAQRGLELFDELDSRAEYIDEDSDYV